MSNASRPVRLTGVERFPYRIAASVRGVPLPSVTVWASDPNEALASYQAEGSGADGVMVYQCPMRLRLVWTSGWGRS